MTDAGHASSQGSVQPCAGDLFGLAGANLCHPQRLPQASTKSAETTVESGRMVSLLVALLSHHVVDTEKSLLYCWTEWENGETYVEWSSAELFLSAAC